MIRTPPLLETSDALLAAGVSKPVFDCKWPETRALAASLWKALPDGLADELYEAPYSGRQDHINGRFLERWIDWTAVALQLDHTALAYRYAAAGSSEGIRERIAHYAVERHQCGRPPVLHVLDGDYEGYAALAEGYGIAVIRHDRARWAESLSACVRSPDADDLVLLSQPSAIDGNLWGDLDEFLSFIEQRYPRLRVGLDVTYVGSVARAYGIDARSPAIETIFFSLSKVFGVYYHRIGGVLTRQALPGLFGNKWFRNTFSLHLGERLMAGHGLHEIPGRYAPRQAEAVSRVSSALGVPAVASDVVLLASHPWQDDLPAVVTPLRRGPMVRYCLTPALDRLLAESGPDGARSRGSMDDRADEPDRSGIATAPPCET